jgi:predicted dithiol-disulfide oxidoreductase (DUF899 family)
MKNDGGSVLKDHSVVSHEKWLKARTAFLEKEKEFTRLRDELNQRRRELPWEVVEKEYVFDGPNGRQTLDDLFDGRSQLVVYHAMFDPKSASASSSWTKDAACEQCSFWADTFNGIIVHLNHRDVTMLAVSRGPYAALNTYKGRMGWSFKWVSSGESDFNIDYQVSFTPEEMARKAGTYNYNQQPDHSEMHGISIFYKDPAGKVFHTYSSYSRGIDSLNATYQYLDLVPKGRDEGDRGPSWVCRHDEYADNAASHKGCGEQR